MSRIEAISNDYDNNDRPQVSFGSYMQDAMQEASVFMKRTAGTAAQAAAALPGLLSNPAPGGTTTAAHE